MAERITTGDVCAIKAIEKEVTSTQLSQPILYWEKMYGKTDKVIIENDDIAITMLERDVLALGGEKGQCRLFPRSETSPF